MPPCCGWVSPQFSVTWPCRRRLDMGLRRQGGGSACGMTGEDPSLVTTYCQFHAWSNAGWDNLSEARPSRTCGSPARKVAYWRGCLVYPQCTWGQVIPTPNFLEILKINSRIFCAARSRAPRLEKRMGNGESQSSSFSASFGSRGRRRTDAGYFGSAGERCRQALPVGNHHGCFARCGGGFQAGS